MSKFELMSKDGIISGPKYSIGKDKAISLAMTGWWKDLNTRDIVGFQLFIKELCMDFGNFHEAVKKSLGRSVFTHEFDTSYDKIISEFLGGNDYPTMSDVISLIPENHRKSISLNIQDYV